MRKLVGAGLFLTLAVTGLLAPLRAWPEERDVASEKPRFEVASIRPSDPDSDFPLIRPTRDGLRIKECTVEMLVLWANGAHKIGDHPVRGLPKWASSDRYDIMAKMSDADASAISKLGIDAQENVLERMLQSLLKERFQLSMHRERIEVPAYELVVAKGGHRLKEGKRNPELPNGSLQIAGGHLSGEGIPARRIAEALSSLLRYEVVDKTGLKGLYDVSLEWQQEQGQAETVPGPAAVPQGSQKFELDGLILSMVRKQLGLMLQPAKAPGEALVVNHVEKPSPN